MILLPGDLVLSLFASLWMRLVLYHRSPHPTAQRPEWN